MLLRVRDFCKSTNNSNHRDITFDDKGDGYDDGDGNGDTGSTIFPVRILPRWYTNNILSPTNTNINTNTTMFRLYIPISSASSASLSSSASSSLHTLNSN